MGGLYNMRVGVNAVIVRHGAVLAVLFEDEHGRHFNLPGGGVEPGEAILDGLRREVREETCAEVEPGSLLLVYEYLPERCRNRYGPGRRLTLFFRCDLKPGSEPKMPERPDRHQVGLEWIPIRELPSAPLLPKIGSRLVALLQQEVPVVFVEEGELGE